MAEAPGLEGEPVAAEVPALVVVVAGPGAAALAEAAEEARG